MPVGIRLDVETREFRRAMRRVRNDSLPKAVAQMLNGAAFDIRDAEALEARETFTFHGPSTLSFLSGRQAYRVYERANPRRLRAVIGPSPLSEDIIEDHVLGGTRQPEDKLQLAVKSQRRLQIAVPVEVPVGGRGRVAQRFTPTVLLNRPNEDSLRAFVLGRALVQRTRRGLKTVYALTPSFTLRPELDFYGTARRTWNRVLPKQARRARNRLERRGI